MYKSDYVNALYPFCNTMFPERHSAALNDEYCGGKG